MTVARSTFWGDLKLVLIISFWCLLGLAVLWGMMELIGLLDAPEPEGYDRWM